MHVVVVGSGIAGLTAAVRASTVHDVTLVTKGALADGATAYAQGGIAVALGADDSAVLHQRDTQVAAAGSADARAVDVLCTDGPARVRDLLALGVPFDRTTDPDAIDARPHTAGGGSCTPTATPPAPRSNGPSSPRCTADTSRSSSGPA
jgi:L-aspartate oxidase